MFDSKSCHCLGNSPTQEGQQVGHYQVPKHQVCGPYPAPSEGEDQVMEEKTGIAQGNHSLCQEDDSHSHGTGCHPATSLLSQPEGPAGEQEAWAARVLSTKAQHSPLKNSYSKNLLCVSFFKAISKRFLCI